MTTTDPKLRSLVCRDWEIAAYQSGRKTVFLRPNKHPVEFLGAGGKDGAEWNDPRYWGWEDPDDPGHFVVLSQTPNAGDTSLPSPFGAPGDVLGLKGAWARGLDHEGNSLIVYRAVPERGRYALHDCEGEGDFVRLGDPADVYSHCRWCPAQSMRLDHVFPEFKPPVLSVSVCRVQELTEADAQHAGMKRPILSEGPVFEAGGMKFPTHPMTGNYIDALKDQLNHDYGPGTYERNLWVWRAEVKNGN